MIGRSILISLNATLFCILLSASQARGQGQDKPQHISATLAFVGGPAGGKTVDLDFHIKQYAPLEKINQYGELLKEGGQEALLRALEKEDNGQISPVGSTGIPLAVALSEPGAESHSIYILAVRYMPFLELWYGGRSRDYPFAVFELKIGPQGKGSGSAILAAKISFRKKEQTYEIESLGEGTRNVKLLNVRVVD
jgi:hypothetical protein